jgi:UDP-glucose 4-epimerase
MKIAVTGGAGYIGSTLVRNLVRRGDTVISVDNLMIGDYQFLINDEDGRKAERIIGDIRNLELLKEVWIDSDAIVHLAAIAGLEKCNENPEDAISVNIYGTYQVLEAARILDINRVVFCSSASVYGMPVNMPVTETHQLRPLNLYGVTKVAGEKIMDTYWDNYDIETVNLRFGNIYGVGLYSRWDTVIPKFINQAISGEPLTIYGDGEYSRDFVHVEDITKALILGLIVKGIGGEAFNVGGETLSINNIAKIITEEFTAITKKKSSSINRPPREGETKEFSYDLKKIKTMLDFQNTWNVRKGIKQLIEYTLSIKEKRGCL